MKVFLDNHKDKMLAVFRIVVGLLFMAHGSQKLFGDVFDPTSLMGIGGLIEFVGGLLIAVGFFTHIVSFVCSGQMFVAYFMFHAEYNLFSSPLANKGELALLYAVVFLLLTFKGPGAWSLDTYLANRR
ncbi:DoxX family protein [Candidatus Pacearchaeota archaeon]|nr:DoxX family protein [Candidatus Pacearchaeota archaeon]